MKYVILALILGMVLLSGCPQAETGNSGTAASAKETATQKCEMLCNAALAQGVNLENGPCLSSGNSDWSVQDWVCDIAHEPRQEVDNLKENQCPEWSAESKGFVEFSPQCEFIRAYGRE